MPLTKKLAAAVSLLVHPRRVRHAPIQANVEVTSACNLDCIMCDRARTVGKGDMMSLESFQEIVAEVRPSTINFSGNGEPLLNKAIYAMIRYAKGRGIHTHLTSNFTMMRAKAAELVATGLDFVKVSIDGARDETFRAVRRVPLQSVLDGVDALVAARRAAGRDRPRLRVNMVVLNQNFGEIEEMVRLAAEHAIDAVQYKYCQTFNLGKGDVADRIPLAELEAEIARARASARRLGVDTNLGVFRQEVAVLARRGDRPPPAVGGPVCVAPWTWVYVDVHGKVCPCCYFAYRQLEDHFGNLRETDFEAIWNGPTYRRFRDDFRNRKRGYEVCRHCVAPTLASVVGNYRNIRHMVKV